jgi:hypothetical protein
VEVQVQDAPALARGDRIGGQDALLVGLRFTLGGGRTLPLPP